MPGRCKYIGSLLVQTLHAPGKITWQLDGSGKQELVFDYASFMPEAVNRAETAMAPIFILEVHSHLKVVPPEGTLSQIASIPSVAPPDRI